MLLKNLFAGKHWKKDIEERLNRHAERGGDGEMYQESNTESYFTICMHVRK